MTSSLRHAIYVERMWVMSVLFIVKVTLCFHQILPHYRGYAYDCAWFTHDTIERIKKKMKPYSHESVLIAEKSVSIRIETQARG